VLRWPWGNSGPRTGLGGSCCRLTSTACVCRHWPHLPSQQRGRSCCAPQSHGRAASEACGLCGVAGCCVQGRGGLGTHRTRVVGLPVEEAKHLGEALDGAAFTQLIKPAAPEAGCNQGAVGCPPGPPPRAPPPPPPGATPGGGGGGGGVCSLELPVRVGCKPFPVNGLDPGGANERRARQPHAVALQRRGVPGSNAMRAPRNQWPDRPWRTLEGSRARQLCCRRTRLPRPGRCVDTGPLRAAAHSPAGPRELQTGRSQHQGFE